MEKRLKNLSILISDYHIYARDLVFFAYINPEKELSKDILTKAFVAVYRSMKGGKESLPLHLLIYSKTIDVIKKSKDTPEIRKENVKNMGISVDIENYLPFKPDRHKLLDALNNIEPEDRMLLCMSIRHKINTMELSNVFKTSPGTILSRISNALTKIAKALIIDSGKEKENIIIHSDSKECFFVKNDVYNIKNTEHIAKCVGCKNFYEWHKIAEELILIQDKPSPDISINSKIFKHLNFFSLDKRILYNFRTRWLVRLILIIVFIGIGFIITKYVTGHSKEVLNNTEEVKITESKHNEP